MVFFSYFCKIFFLKLTIKLNENCLSNDGYFLQTHKKNFQRYNQSNNRFADLVLSCWFVASRVSYKRFYGVYAEWNGLFSSSVLVSRSLRRIFPPILSCFLFFKYVHGLFFRVVYNIPTDNFVQVHVMCFLHLSLSKFVDVYIYPFTLISLIRLFVCSCFPFC